MTRRGMIDSRKVDGDASDKECDAGGVVALSGCGAMEGMCCLGRASQQKIG